MNEVEAVELSNGAFDVLMKLFKVFPFRLFTKKKLDWAQKTQQLPKEYHPKKIKFLAVGSDAHTFDDIGNHVVLKVSHLDKKTVFHKLINNTDGELMLTHKKLNLLVLLKNLPIVLNEFLLKKKFKLCGKFSSKQSG